MPSFPRIEWASVARLALCSALLCLACGELSQGTDGALYPQRLEPRALLATALVRQFSMATSNLATARAWHTAVLLPSGKVLVSGGVSDSFMPLASAEVYDPVTRVMSPTGSLATARAWHTAVLLPSGKVLVSGGSGSSGPLASAELYDPASGGWSTTGAMATARSGHTATLLPSGKVLVTGGSNSSAEVYDPASGGWSTTGAMATARSGHTATLLPSGKVLVSGGQNSSGYLASTEVYDPASGTWSSTSPMTSARSEHTATLLYSGQVLISGGKQGDSSLLASAEVYDPATGAWSLTGAMATGRHGHAAALLPSGKVLVIGDKESFIDDPFASAEVYDPATGAWGTGGTVFWMHIGHTATLLPSGKVFVNGGWDFHYWVPRSEATVVGLDTANWSTTGALAAARSGHSATLLPSGKVLVAGGQGSSGPLASAEVYTPATGAWNMTGGLSTGRSGHSATLLPSGKVLVTGGQDSSGALASAEVYDPATANWTTTGPLAAARSGHTATLLPSGKVLVTGGQGSGGPLASAEVYNPDTGTWSPTDSLDAARAFHTATLLPSGKVLVAGGQGSSGPLASAELYDPDTRTWKYTGLLDAARAFHTAALLPSGKVLVTEGQDSSGPLFTVELYDPDTGKWSPMDGWHYSRYGHTATLLPSGQVLVAGGSYSGPFEYVGVYDPALGQWRDTDSLAFASRLHTATLLPSGQVLVAGGEGPSGPLARAEIYDGTGALQGWGPVITPPGTQRPGEIFPITGSHLLGLSEASNGTTQSSATNFPLVSLLALEGGALTCASGLQSFSDTQVTVRTPQVPNGFYILSVMTNAIHGGQIVGVYRQPLAALGFTSPPASVNTHMPEIAGTAEPNSTIRVWVDEAMVASINADEQGRWSFNPGTSLAEGDHRILAFAKDASGNISPDSEYLFKVDTVPPQAPVLTAPGAYVPTPQPLVAGIAEPHSIVRVWLGEVEVTGGTIEANAAGDWSLPLTVTLADGTYPVKATATDTAGNVSSTFSALTFTVDTVPPEAPEVTAPGAFVNTHTPVIGGAAEPGCTVTVSVGGMEAGRVVTDSEGTWSITLDTELPDGPHQVQATATDNAGHVSPPSGLHEFSVDTEAPGAPVVTAPGDFINTRPFIIRGTAERNSAVTVWLDGDDAQAATVVADSTGSWRFTSPSTLEFGSHSVSAFVADDAGNHSPTSLHRFSLQRSHYGLGCSSGPASPAAWVLFALAGSLATRCFRSDNLSGTARPRRAAKRHS